MKSIICFAVLLAAFQQLSAQSCPACSNPALQSSEKLEAGTDSLQGGTMRLTLNITNGFNYQGGHQNLKGLSSEGQVIDVPLHEHTVDLDFLRSELSFEYTFKTNWSIWLRVPYDVKMQTATVEFVQPVTNYESEAILRNRDIHHRTETYTGFSDLRFLMAHRFSRFFSKKARLDLAFGTSLPLGVIEENPLKAGNEGVEHLHIQFGSGTFDPLLEFHYGTVLAKRLYLAVFTMNKFPLYYNRNSYKGPLETTNGIGLSYRIKPWLVIRGTFANFSQGRAYWDSVKDPNSGLISWNATGNLTFRFKRRLTVTPGYRFPIHQRTLSADGDGFKYGPTFLMNISYLFDKE